MNFITQRSVRFIKFWKKISGVIGICILFANCSMQSSLVSINQAQTLPKLEVPKIYAGEDFFVKREIFRYEKTKKEKEIPIGSFAPKDGERPPKIDKDEFELNNIEQIYAGEID